MILTDQSRVTVNKQVEPISIFLGNLTTKIGGLIFPNLNIDIIAGIDWLCQLKPMIDWETSTLIVIRGGVNFNVYPVGMHHLLKDFVFVKVVEVEEDGKTNWDHCEFHCIRFYNVSAQEHKDPRVQILLYEFWDIFKDSLNGLPPPQLIKHRIKLLESMPKLAPIYQLTPKEDKTP